MNAIRATQTLNRRELEQAIPPSASWHVDYRDTAWVYVGGLPLDLSEGDVVTIFSQFGSPTHLNLIRDRETGRTKGFGFLKYEDQRSCDLAVDNLGGAEVLGRTLRVDHTRYKRREGEDEETYLIERLEAEAVEGVNGNGKRASDTEDESGEERKKRVKTIRDRPMLKEERELQKLLQAQEGEEEDPMRDYLIREKKEEVERAKEKERERRHKHRHRQRGDNDDEGSRERRHGYRHRRQRGNEDEAEDGPRTRRHQHRQREDDGDRRRGHRRDDEDESHATKNESDTRSRSPRKDDRGQRGRDRGDDRDQEGYGQTSYRHRNPRSSRESEDYGTGGHKPRRRSRDGARGDGHNDRDRYR